MTPCTGIFLAQCLVIILLAIRLRRQARRLRIYDQEWLSKQRWVKGWL